MCHVFKISKIRRQYYLKNETKIVEIREYNVGDKDTFINKMSISGVFVTFWPCFFKKLSLIFGQQSDMPKVICIKLKKQIFPWFWNRVSILFVSFTRGDGTQNKIWTTKWQEFFRCNGLFYVFSVLSNEQFMKFLQCVPTYLVLRFVE